jgi:hypothetical protein
MSTTQSAITSANVHSFLRRAKTLAGAALFLLVQRFPRLMQLHRNEKSWTLFRVALACSGAALVVLPLSLWNGRVTAIFGLFLFIAAILLPPAQTESATDRKAHELGAQTVVSGGSYQPGNAPAAHVNLFLSPVHIWALDKNFEPLLVISTPEISNLCVEPAGERWLLQVRWADHKAEFCFNGFFAERLARLAEDSIRAMAPVELPAYPMRRAAGV